MFGVRIISFGHRNNGLSHSRTLQISLLRRDAVVQVCYIKARGVRVVELWSAYGGGFLHPLHHAPHDSYGQYRVNAATTYSVWFAIFE